MFCPPAFPRFAITAWQAPPRVQTCSEHSNSSKPQHHNARLRRRLRLLRSAPGLAHGVLVATRATCTSLSLCARAVSSLHDPLPTITPSPPSWPIAYLPTMGRRHRVPPGPPNPGFLGFHPPAASQRGLSPRQHSPTRHSWASRFPSEAPSFFQGLRRSAAGFSSTRLSVALRATESLNSLVRACPKRGCFGACMISTDVLSR